MSTDQREQMDIPDDSVITLNDSVISDSDNFTAYHSVISTSEEQNMSPSKHSENSSLLEAIENLFDAKFNKLEQRLNEVIQKNEMFTIQITDHIKNQRHISHVVELTNVNFNDDEIKDGVEKKRAENTIVIPKCFVDSVEEKLSQISQSIDRYERQQDEDSEKISDLSSKCTSLETSLQTLEELQELTPTITSIQKDLNTILNCESEANDVMDKVVPMVTKIQDDIAMIGKDVSKINKQQELDYRKLKDDVLYNMQRAIDDTYGQANHTKVLNLELLEVVERKTDDLKRNGRDVIETTEDLLDKMSKVEKSIEEVVRCSVRNTSQSRCGPNERSPSPSQDNAKATHADKDHSTGCALPDDNSIKLQLTNIESVLSDVMLEIRKTNVGGLIEQHVIPKLHSRHKEVDYSNQQNPYKLSEKKNAKKTSAKGKNRDESRSRTKSKDSIKQAIRKPLTEYSVSTEDLGSLLDKVDSMKPINKWTYDDIPSIDIKPMERKRNSSSSSSSSSSDREKNGRGVQKPSNNKRNIVDSQNKVISRSRLKSNLKLALKKRRRASTESTSSSDDSTSTLAEHLTNAAMARQVSKISIAVEGMQDKIEQLIKISKATPTLSDENQMLTSGGTVQNLGFVSEKIESLLSNQSKNQISQTAKMENDIKKLSGFSSELDHMMKKLQEIECLSNVQCKEIESLKMTLKDTNNESESKVDEVLQRVKSFQPNNPLINETLNGKLDEVLQKIKSTQKGTNQYKETSLSMMSVLMEVKKHVLESDKVGKDHEHPKGRNDGELISMLKSIQPKIEDWPNKAFPVLEEIRKMQRQINEQKRLEEENSKCHLERILDVVQDIRENKNKKDSKSNTYQEQSSLMNNNSALQMFNALNDLKEQMNDRDQTMVRGLNEMKMDIGTLFPRLHETLKTKSSEKSITKMCSVIEEIKDNQLADMKTFSGMNTMLQGIKASDNKIAAQVKDLKGMFKDNGTGIRGEEHMNLPKDFKDLEIKNDLALENMKVFQKDGFDEMKGLLHLVTKSIETISKVSESHSPKKDQKHAYDVTTILTRLSQIIANNENFSDDIKKRFQDQSKLIKGLLSKVNEKEKNSSTSNSLKRAMSKSKMAEDEEITRKIQALHADFKEDIDNLEQKLFSTYNETSSKILEELGKIKEDDGAHSEILNSVEDLKLLTSSTPNAVHDILTQIEKMAAGIAKIPDDIGSYTAGLEENLCANLEGRIKEIHIESLNIIEQRLAVIKKYVKYGYNSANDNSLLERNDSSTPEQDASNRLVNDDGHSTNRLSLPNPAELVNSITQECKLIFDNSSNQFKNDLEEIIDAKIGMTLNTICTVEEQILNEQAKAVVLEEQFEALVNTIMEPILELKSSQSELTKNVVKSSIEEMEESHVSRHKECLEILKDIRNISDIATSYGPALAENKHAIQLVARLVKHLIDVQRMQEELLKQGDKSIEYQTATNQIYGTLVPTLEEIQKFLKLGENQVIDFAEIPELTKQLLNKINSLNELESRLLASPRLSNCEDLSELIITCLTVLDNLVTSVTEDPLPNCTKTNGIKPLDSKKIEVDKDSNTRSRTKKGMNSFSRNKPKSSSKLIAVAARTSQDSLKSTTSRASVLDSKVAESVSYPNTLACKPKSRSRSRGTRSEQDVINATQTTSQPIERLNDQVDLRGNEVLTSRGKNVKTSAPRRKRNRPTSSSADDSGCGDTTPPSTRDSGTSSAIKSPLIQESDHVSADFQNDEHEKNDLPKIIDVKGSSHTTTEQTEETSNTWGPKRRRAYNADDGEYSEKEDSICSVTMDFDDAASMTNTNQLQNVSEDEAKKPAWQPKVIVSKGLSNTALEIKGVAKFDKSPLSICSSPSTYSISSVHSTDEKEIIKIKH